MFSNNNVIGKEILTKNFENLYKNSLFFIKYEFDTSVDGFLGSGTFSVCRFVCLF